MPKRSRKYTRKPRKRRRRFFRRRRYTRRALVLGGFPKSKLVRLRYVEEININPGLGQVASYVYSANGMYDPNITGVGHQPSNFDVWFGNNPIYNHYTVIGSRIKVTPVRADSGIATPLAYYGVLLSDDGLQAASLQVQDILEQKLTTFSRVPAGYSNGNHGRSLSVHKKFSARKFFGRARGTIAAADELRGGPINNPSEGAFFEIFAASVLGNDPAQQSFLVEIEYIALLIEPAINTYS